MKRVLIRIGVAILALVAAIVLVIGLNMRPQTRAKASINPRRTLIIYFSMSGNTKQAAQQIHRYTGAKMVRLYRAKP